MSAPWCPARSATTGRCRTPRAGCRWPELDLHAGRRSAGRRAWAAMHLVLALLGALRAALGARTDLVLENLALRQQFALLRRRSTRPRFGPLDRLFWIWLSQRWARSRETLNVVRPETVIRWHSAAHPWRAPQARSQHF